MPPAKLSLEDGTRRVVNDGHHDNSLRANWRILAVTLYMGISLFEYGFDKGAIAGFQAMPGFLMVFGYKTPSGKWGIHVRPCYTNCFLSTVC